jgi:hypothetical protein
MTGAQEITLDEFGAAFPGLFNQEAYRLELFDFYESPHYRRWQAGEAYDRSAWDTMLAQGRRTGRVVRRVHVIPQQLTDYLRHELDYYRGSVAAGEDVRLLPREQAAGLDLPEFDYWLFDSRVAAFLDYDQAGICTSVRMSDSPQVVADCIRWRDSALSRAISLSEFQAGAAA